MAPSKVLLVAASLAVAQGATPQVFCTVFTDGLDSNIVGSDVCWRMEYEAQMGERVVCRPTVGPAGSAYNGCPSDHSRGNAAFTNKVYPYCDCTVFKVDQDAALSMAAPLAGRACQKVETNQPTICYPMLTDFNHMRGDDYKYYGCPVDMQACLLGKLFLSSSGMVTTLANEGGVTIGAYVTANFASAGFTFVGTNLGACTGTGTLLAAPSVCSSTPTPTWNEAEQSMQFSGSVPSATSGCETANSCYAGALDTQSYNVNAGGSFTASFKAEGGGDWYEVIIQLCKGNQATDSCTSAGHIIYRGDALATFTSHTFTVATTGSYWLRFLVGSYDRTGGSLLGAKLIVQHFTRANP